MSSSYPGERRSVERGAAKQGEEEEGRRTMGGVAAAKNKQHYFNLKNIKKYENSRLQFLTALPRLQRESRKCGQELYRYRYGTGILS